MEFFIFDFLISVTEEIVINHWNINVLSTILQFWFLFSVAYITWITSYVRSDSVNLRYFLWFITDQSSCILWSFWNGVLHDFDNSQ